MNVFRLYLFDYLIVSQSFGYAVNIIFKRKCDKKMNYFRCARLYLNKPPSA